MLKFISLPLLLFFTISYSYADKIIQAIGTDDLVIKTSGVTALKIKTSGVMEFPLLSASCVPFVDASNFLSCHPDTSPTELGYVDGVTSAIQAQLDALTSSSLSTGFIYVGDATGTAAGVAMSGDVTITDAGVTAIGVDKVLSSMILDGEIANVDISATASIPYSKIYIVDDELPVAKINGLTPLLDAKLALTGGVMTGSITLSTQGEIRLGDADSSNFVTLKSTGVVASDYTLTFPIDDGTASQFLTTDGAGDLSWTTPGVAAGAVNAPDALQNVGIEIVMAANAVTVSLKQSDGSTDPTGGSPSEIGFRDSTATVGGYNIRSVTTATTVVISSGSDLGTSSGRRDKIYVYALDDGGNVALGVSKKRFKEHEVLTTTAEGGAGAADDEYTIYSREVLTDVPIQLLGTFTSSQTTAGTWAASADKVTAGNNRHAAPHAIYTTASGQAIGTGITTIDFNTKIFDNFPAGAITTGASWIFIAPYTGRYFVYMSTQLASVANSTTDRYNVLTFKNGLNYRTIGYLLGNGATNVQTLNGGTGYDLIEGDRLQFYGANSNATTLIADDKYNYITIFFIKD